MILCLSYVCSPFYIPHYICLNGAHFSLEYCGMGSKTACMSISSPIYNSQKQCLFGLGPVCVPDQAPIWFEPVLPFALVREPGHDCVQARVVRKGRVFFKDYGLLPGRLPGAHGYLGGEDFLRLEDFKAKCKREWTFDIVLRNYDSVRNNSCGAIGNWWSGGKSWSCCGG
jgi:hypothetical protein